MPYADVRRLLAAFLFVGSTAAWSRADEPQATVAVAVADLRRAPNAATELETQLLYGERVAVHESSGPWVRVNALDQPAFHPHQRWEGYPGWMLGNALHRNTPPAANAIISGAQWQPTDQGVLPLGATLFLPTPASRPPSMKAWPISESPNRRSILATAALLLGTRYQWGGMIGSGLNQKKPTIDVEMGIDCSGLTHISYRVSGITIPRDSYDQWKKATPIGRAALQPADLIFAAKTVDPKKVVHVALYAGNGEILEAPQTGMAVRRISFKDKFGCELSQIESGGTAGDHVVYFGRFLPS